MENLYRRGAVDLTNEVISLIRHWLIDEGTHQWLNVIYYRLEITSGDVDRIIESRDFDQISSADEGHQGHQYRWNFST